MSLIGILLLSDWIKAKVLFTVLLRTCLLAPSGFLLGNQGICCNVQAMNNWALNFCFQYPDSALLHLTLLHQLGHLGHCLLLNLHLHTHSWWHYSSIWQCEWTTVLRQLRSLRLSACCPMIAKRARSQAQWQPIPSTNPDCFPCCVHTCPFSLVYTTARWLICSSNWCCSQIHFHSSFHGCLIVTDAWRLDTGIATSIVSLWNKVVIIPHYQKNWVLNYVIN